MTSALNEQSLDQIFRSARTPWDVAELWTDADRLFAVFGLVAAEPAQGS
jgi:hypothetical protein